MLSTNLQVIMQIRPQTCLYIGIHFEKEHTRNTCIQQNMIKYWIDVQVDSLLTNSYLCLTVEALRCSLPRNKVVSPETALLLCMALLFVVSASTYNYYPVVQAAAAYNKLDIKYVNKTPIYTVVNVKHLTDHNWKYSSFWLFYLQNTSWENYLFHMPGDSQTEEIHSNTPDMGDRNSPMSTEASML